jgi:hypothetical protein
VVRLVTWTRCDGQIWDVVRRYREFCAIDILVSAAFSLRLLAAQS